MVKQSEQDAELAAALHALTDEIRSIKQAKAPSTTAIVGVLGVALVIAAYIVSISMYNASLAGDLKNQQTQIENLKTQKAELKEEIESMKKETSDDRKAIQTLREMYFLEFGRKPSSKP